MIRLVLIIGCLLTGYFLQTYADGGPPQVISPTELAQAQKQYGPLAANRLKAWQEMVNHAYHKPERLQLEIVNRFFNKARYKTDDQVWHQHDYWATPVELLEKDAGDCEDYVIAKYFTLKALGISEKKLYLTYVKAIRFKQAHMVLTYFKTPKSIPLVLDNLNDRILKATQRRDLIPVYSFNGDGLWLSKLRGKGKSVNGGSKKIEQWQTLLKKLDKRNAP